MKKLLILLLLVYTIAYGAPEIKDPKEGVKIALSTLSLIGVAVGLFAFARSFGKPSTKLLSINLSVCFSHKF